MILQDRECGGVAQGDGGHVECHTDRVYRDKHGLVRDFGLHAHVEQGDHADARQQVADAQQALWLNPLVGDNAHERGHENGNNALNSIEP